jgi:metal-responsive CopG/Arc/MetJ family transcriptional regulator
MPVSVHIPRALLANVDRRAKKLGLTRSGFVTRALEHELAVADRWSKGFIEHFRATTPHDATAVDELLHAVQAARTRKGPPKL